MLNSMRGIRTNYGPSKEFQSLDASLLLQTQNIPAHSNVAGPQSLIAFDTTSATSSPDVLTPSKRDQDVHWQRDNRAGGVDNVGFDLDHQLEAEKAGSRKPIISTHVRTHSLEDYLKNCVALAKSPRMGAPEYSKGPLSLPSSIQIRDNQDMTLNQSDKITNEISNVSTPPLRGRMSNGRYSDTIISSHNIPSNSSLDSIITPQKVCSVKDFIENDLKHSVTKPEMVNWNKKNEDEISKSLPLNLCKKKINTAKKTEVGSPLSIPTRETGELGSRCGTMVQVGSATRFSTSQNQSVQVSSQPLVVVSSVSTTLPTNSSRVSVLCGNNITNNRVSSCVVLTSGVCEPSIAVAPSVSALSKVSSVRIVPSPASTPTPSLIGIESSSHVSSKPPISLSRQSRTVVNNVKSTNENPSVGTSTIPSTSLPSTAPIPSQSTSKTKGHPSPHRRPPSGHNIKPSTGGSSHTRGPSPPKPQESSSVPNAPKHTPGGEQLHVVTPVQSQEGNTSQTPTNPPSVPSSEPGRRGDRERRRERRERRRERRAQRGAAPNPYPPPLNGQTEITPPPGAGDAPSQQPAPPHLPDLLNSHIPPPYSTLQSAGPRTLGGLLGPPQPPPLPMHVPHPPLPGVQYAPPPGPPPPPHGSPIRPPPPHENLWHFFGSRRSRGPPYLPDEEAKSCCGLLVTQAVSIRWFIIMIAFVGLCCTVVGTVLGAVKTNSSEYVTITLLMIGVGIVLITVSGVAWHLTSRDAPCRVMLGLSPSDSSRGEARRFMTRMAPTFGRAHHPYAAMMYPEFQYRPPPPSYQASMQEYRLRMLLLDRHNSHPVPPTQPVLPSSPPNYPHGYPIRGPPATTGTATQESDYSRPPSYRSIEGSVSHHPDAPPTSHPGGGSIPPVHSRGPSCLSFLSHESLYSSAPTSHEGSTRRRGLTGGTNGSSKMAVVVNGSEEMLEAPKMWSSNPKDDNTVTIVQTTDSSQVMGTDSVIVTVSGVDITHQQSGLAPSDAEISVLARL